MRYVLICFLFFLAFRCLAVTPAPVVVHNPLGWVQQQLALTEAKLRALNQGVNNQAQIRQIALLAKTLHKMELQYLQIKRTSEALSGKYGYGRWLKGPARLLDPYYHPSSTRELFDLMRRGGGSGRYSDRVSVYQEKYPSANRDDVFPYKPDSPEAHQYESLAVNTGALSVSGEMIYDSIANRKKIILALQGEIDETDNIKASMDLNNRLMVELNMVMVDALHLQSLQAQSTAAVNQAKVNQSYSQSIVFGERGDHRE